MGVPSSKKLPSIILGSLSIRKLNELISIPLYMATMRFDGRV